MSMLDEGFVLRALSRKNFLLTLISRCTTKMSQSGLQGELESARADLESEWMRQAEARVKRGPVDEAFRRRRSELATEVIETEEWL